MSYFKAVFDTSRPLGVKVPEERDIHSKMSTNPIFADPPVAYADFQLALKEQDTAIDNAEFGDIERTAAKRTAEQKVDDMVRKLKSYVTVVANGNTDIILSSGFRHTKPRQRAGEMPKVSGLRGMNSEKSGEMKLSWKAVDNAGFYQVQLRPLNDAEKPTDPNNLNIKRPRIRLFALGPRPGRVRGRARGPLTRPDAARPPHRPLGERARPLVGQHGLDRADARVPLLLR